MGVEREAQAIDIDFCMMAGGNEVNFSDREAALAEALLYAQPLKERDDGQMNHLVGWHELEENICDRKTALAEALLFAQSLKDRDAGRTDLGDLREMAARELGEIVRMVPVDRHPREPGEFHNSHLVMDNAS